ncbi:MAG TPA: hypothetical protein PLT00_06235 [Verrucomicrobiota bacterium]|jgi:hypothetical protein|nr:hypothetical protein [Verrucomicrobiota bacterium]OQB88493.1 MAG: hypothetical protein BWX84_02982 [Verrucomicrobia bacterium ADurb.Bin118]HPY29798.1 hypothetical protein [Verrucomicrobiota bacterium]HQB16295.1 hypothetical protein [Verrucomicrobiota bacterium]
MIEGLKPYAEYKESGSPWLGAVPEHWEVISLKHWVRINRAVLPHAPDAWYVPESVKTGYEISFTRYFYQPQPLRPLAEIRADILALQTQTEGLLAEILGSGGAA